MILMKRMKECSKNTGYYTPTHYYYHSIIYTLQAVVRHKNKKERYVIKKIKSCLVYLYLAVAISQMHYS